MTVNGVIYPFLDVVPTGLYVFRMLNACDSRYLRLHFEVEGRETRVPFTVLASDQGLVSDTEEMDEIIMGPAERYEIVVSFKDFADEIITVKNSEPTLLGPVEDGVDDQFMQFHVGSYGNGTQPDLPAWNSTEVPYDSLFQHLIDITKPDVCDDNILKDYVNKRELWITEGTQVLANHTSAAGGRPLPMLGPRQNPFGLPYAAAATEVFVQNKPIVWEFINLSADAHVIHLHQVRYALAAAPFTLSFVLFSTWQFRCSCPHFDLLLCSNLKQIAFKIIDRQAVGLSYDTFQHPAGKYRQYPKDSEFPGVYESGPKDVFITYPGTVTRIVANFDLNGTYVWHVS